MREYIDAASFKDMVLCADAALHENIRAVNELNVFPVPDGDTGTNMGLTIGTAATELRKRDFDNVSAVADCVASAMLRGARGNSGVILSLLFRGISRRLKGLETAGALEFCGAMTDGVEAAYKAVMKPAEGTILTVSRLAAQAAAEAVSAGASLENCLSCAIKAGEEALEDTVNLNPVLKKAGVVDAGGKGYIIILSAMLASLRGEFEVPEEHAEIVDEEEASVFSGITDEEITFDFDTVYVVRKKEPDIDLEPLRAYLTSIGDSLVIGEDDETFKVHVHTDIPGDALTESQKYGTLELAKIENMRTQYEALQAGKKSISTDDLDQIERELEEKEHGNADSAQEPDDYIAEPEKEFGVVAVSAGKGIEGLFRELGADCVVTGGQTMNPSTDDILKAVNHTPASTVFVFPNNKNIIMAAQQCQPLTEKKVIVMQSKTVPQGISALLNFNPEAAEDELVSDMNEAMSRVHTVMVTYAARDSEFGGYSIRKGEYLALLDGALIGSFTGVSVMFEKIGEKVKEFNPEFVTVYYGEDVSEDTAMAETGDFVSSFDDCEVSVVNGGQPVYYYMISIE